MRTEDCEAEVPQRITGRTELLALLADPIRHSSSPRMHNLAAAKLGLDYAYLCFEVGAEELPGAIAALRTLRVRGANISMPNKAAVLAHVDRVEPAAELIGAANTIVNDAGVLTAHNTDGLGAVRALQEHGVELAGARVVVLGAGGAGTAIAVQAALEGAAHIALVNRDDAFRSAAEDVAARIGTHTQARVTLHDLDDAADVHAALSGAAVLVDATRLGMTPHEEETPIPDVSAIPTGTFVMDVVYSPARTRLLRECAAAGLRCTNGLAMMFHQGAESFRLWTGRAMPLEYVRAHLDLGVTRPATTEGER